MAAYKYTKEALEEAAARSKSVRELVIYITGKPPSGGTQNHVSMLLKRHEIDISHFHGQGWRKGQTFVKEYKAPEFYLVKQDNSEPRFRANFIRRALLQIGRKYVCEICGLGPEWNGKSLTLQIDHIDGNTFNHTKENLRFVCPNCHTQTETWGRRPSSPTAEASGREPE